MRQNPKLQDSEGFSLGFNYNFSLELLQGLLYISNFLTRFLFVSPTPNSCPKKRSSMSETLQLEQLTESLQQLLVNPLCHLSVWFSC